MRMSALLIFGAGAASLAYLMNRQSRAQRAVAPAIRPRPIDGGLRVAG